MLRLSVTTVFQDKAREGQNIWFNFEADFETIEDLHKTLLADGIITGHRVITRMENGVRIVTDRVPYIISKAAVGTICPVTLEYQDRAVEAAQ